MSLQILELIIFAGLAALVLYMLYSVLGRRVGRQPQEGITALRARLTPGAAPRTPEPPAMETLHPGLVALKARDPAFELAKFLEGARGAYEQIVQAFVGGDRATLRNLTAPAVFEAFEPAMASREAEGRTETVEFVHTPRADLEDADVTGAFARLKVRFLSELRSRTRRGDQEDVAERRTAEIWTFERALDGRDPNWMLARVDAAEA